MPSPPANAGKRPVNWRALILALDAFAAREWRWLVVIAWLIISGAYLYRFSASIHWFSLGDTDDNMRYLQVRDWLNGQSWWDLSQHRMNPPEGGNIHWSRIVDLPIAALMLFFGLFMDTAGADRMAVAVAPLIPLLPLMLALAFIARRLAEPKTGGMHPGHALLAAILMPLGANMGIGMYMPLRVDHHGWQLALTAMALAGMVDRKWMRGGIVAGVSSATSIAIGMEMMVYLAAAGGIIALRWVFKEGAARRLRPYALSLGGTTAIGYAAFASNANRLPVCDALSPVWASILILAAGVLLLISLLPLRGWQQRLVVAAIGGAIVGGFALWAFPQCLTGAYQISPELEKSWLSYIREAKPLTAQGRSSWLPMSALPVAGLLCGLIGCWAARRDVERLWAWGTVMLMTAFAFALMFWQIRAGAAAQLIAIPPVAWAMWELVMRLLTGRWLTRIGAVLGLAVVGSAASAYALYPVANKAITDLLPKPAEKAPVGTATVATGAPPKPGAATAAAPKAETAQASTPAKPKPRNTSNRCRTVPALQPLDQLPPAVIFTLVDLGPRLIAVTHHSAIAGPYHRNGTAILDIHHAFDGTPSRFREIAAAHHAQYLLICPGFPEGTIYPARSPKGFYARVLRGEKFDFLEPVVLDYSGTLPYTLYRIVPEKPAAAPAR